MAHIGYTCGFTPSIGRALGGSSIKGIMGFVSFICDSKMVNRSHGWSVIQADFQVFDDPISSGP